MLPEMPEVDEESEAGCDKAVVSVVLLPFFRSFHVSCYSIYLSFEANPYFRIEHGMGSRLLKKYMVMTSRQNTRRFCFWKQ